MNYRLRNEGPLLILQVWIEKPRDSYSGQLDHIRRGDWRDAAVTDIPVADLFPQTTQVQELEARLEDLASTVMNQRIGP